jgi:transcriptional regulator with XRE-family HTH domain
MRKMRSNFSEKLSGWRGNRRLSQLELSALTGVSQRHISFIESGRARPSRDLIGKLAEGLDLPLRARNDLFLAAGYAALYPERGLEGAAMERAREALSLILAHHEPYPAIVTDASWNIVMQNSATRRIVHRCVDQAALRELTSEGTLNFIRLMFAPNGLRPRILNWPDAREMLLKRLRREANANPNAPAVALLRDVEAKHRREPRKDVATDDGLEPVHATNLLVNGASVRLFSTFATFGTPQDVTLQELRVDMSFPADEETRKFLIEFAASDVAREP